MVRCKHVRHTSTFARTSESRQSFTAIENRALDSTGADATFTVTGACAHAGTIENITCPSFAMRKRTLFATSATFGINCIHAIFAIARAR